MVEVYRVFQVEVSSSLKQLQRRGRKRRFL